MLRGAGAAKVLAGTSTVLLDVVHDSHILQGLPPQSLLHHLAVSLPQPEHKIGEWGCILFVFLPSQESMIPGQEQEE